MPRRGAGDGSGVVAGAEGALNGSHRGVATERPGVALDALKKTVGRLTGAALYLGCFVVHG